MASVAVFLCLMMSWVVLAFLAYYGLTFIFLMKSKSDPQRIKAAFRMADLMLSDRRLRLPTLLFAFGWAAKGIGMIALWYVGAQAAIIIACGALGVLFLSVILAACVKVEPVKLPALAGDQAIPQPVQKNLENAVPALAVPVLSEWEIIAARIRAERRLCPSAAR